MREKEFIFAYGSSQIQSIMVGNYDAKCGQRLVTLHPQSGNRTRERRRAGRSEAISRGPFLLGRLCLLKDPATFPNSIPSWEPAVLTYEPMGDISLSKHEGDNALHFRN